MVNGHVYPEAAQAARAAAIAQPRLLYWNVGGGRFKDICRRRPARGIREPAGRRADPRPAISTTTARSRWS